jgi:hypothetical protein
MTDSLMPRGPGGDGGETTDRARRGKKRRVPRSRNIPHHNHTSPEAAEESDLAGKDAAILDETQE